MARRIKLRHVAKHVEAAKLLKPIVVTALKKRVLSLYTREALMEAHPADFDPIAKYYGVSLSEDQKDMVDDIIQAQFEARTFGKFKT